MWLNCPLCVSQLGQCIHPSIPVVSANGRVVIHVFTWITGVETIKLAADYMQTVRLYGYGPKSVTAGYRAAPSMALSVMTTPLRRNVRQL